MIFKLDIVIPGMITEELPKYILLVACTYVAAVVLYQLYFHPLSQYPGPFLAKFTNLYGGYWSLKKRLHEKTLENHLRYGPVVRVGPNKLVFNTATAFRDIYRNDRLTKTPAYAILSSSPAAHNAFTTPSRQTHRAKRRLINQILSPVFLTTFLPQISAQTDLFLRNLLPPPSSQTHKSVNLSPLLRRLTLEVASLLTFSYPLNLLHPEEDEKKSRNLFLLDIMDSGAYRGNVLLQTFPSFLTSFLTNRQTTTSTSNRATAAAAKMRLLPRLPNSLRSAAYRENRAKYAELVEDMGRWVSRTDDRSAEQMPRSYYDLLVSEKEERERREATAERKQEGGEEEEGKERKIDWLPSPLRSEATLLLTAGGDTTATALACAFWYLARDGAVYERAADEVREVFSSLCFNSEKRREMMDELIRKEAGAAAAAGGGGRGGPEKKKLQYLCACLEEGMRLGCSVAGVLWRVEDEEGRQQIREKEREPVVVDGHVIPRGTEVGVSAYGMHRSDDNFPDAGRFVPERWLENEKSAREAFATFSTGAQGCAGKGLAYLEGMMVLAKTLWYFDFELAEGGDKGKEKEGREFRWQDVFTAKHDGPVLVFKARGEYWRELEVLRGRHE